MSDIIGTPVTVTVSGVRRMPSSPNGNPRYIFDTDSGDIYSTAPDTSCAYRVWGLALEGKRVTLGLNKRGNIIDFAIIGDEN